MDLIEVTILPKHLKGNSWAHQENPESRKCPLQEALIEQGFVGADVCAHFVDLGNASRQYIPMDIWGKESVATYIQKANEGCEDSYTFKLVATLMEGMKLPDFKSEPV